MIRNRILDDIRQAKFYSVIADEASDSANDEQLAISIQYVDTSGNPQEWFLGFSECISGVTGKAIAENITSNLGSWQLELTNMCGQAYDGAGAMSGATKGVAARILEKCPKAQFTHCAAHRLNLCVVKCCTIHEVSNAMDCADGGVWFFNNSRKRQLFFETCVQDERHANPQFEQRTKLKELCRTRWVERHDAFEVFVHLYKPLIVCLETIASSPAAEWNRQTRQDANSLLHSLLRSPLLVALMLTREVLLMTKGLSIKLKGTYVDIVRAHKEVTLVKKQVEENRSKVDDFHQRIYTAALTLAGKVGILEDMPRIHQGRQQHRANPVASSPSDFYRRTITVPMLDHLQNQLNERFDDSSESSNSLKEFMALLPSEIAGKEQQLARTDVARIVNLYKDDLPSEYAIDLELQAWSLKWKGNSESTKYNTIPNALAKADKMLYPNLHILFSIGATLPVTSAVCERSISTLRLLKPAMRSTMTNARMNGLAMMFVHRELADALELQAVVDEFATRHSRRMHIQDLGASLDND